MAARDGFDVSRCANAGFMVCNASWQESMVKQDAIAQMFDLLGLFGDS